MGKQLVTTKPDPQIESVLSLMGLNFKYEPSLDLNSVSWPTNTRGDGVPLDEDNRLLIRLGIARGANLRPIVVSKNGKNFRGEDGRHRTVELLAAGQNHYGAYVIYDISEKELRQLELTLNLDLVGKDVHQTRFALAVDGVLSGAFSKKESAYRFGIPEGSLDTAFRVKDTTDRLQILGFDFEKKRLSQTQLRALATVKERTPALLGAADLAAMYHIGGKELSVITQQLSKAPDDVVLGDILNTERKLRSRTKASLPAPKTILFRSQMTRLRNTLSNKRIIAKALGGLRPSEKEFIGIEIMETLQALKDAQKMLQT
jgi:hypothetical protein